MHYPIAHLSDWEVIARLHAQSWQQHYRGSFSDHYLNQEVLADRRTVWEQRLKNPAANQHVVLAKEAGILYGFVCVYFDESPEWGSLLDNIHVDHQFAGQGIGKALMQKAASTLLEQADSKSMYLLVLEKNVPAHRFYERLGGVAYDPVLMDTPGDGAPAKVIRFYWEDVGVI